MFSYFHNSFVIFDNISILTVINNQCHILKKYGSNGAVNKQAIIYFKAHVYLLFLCIPFFHETLEHDAISCH